MKVKGKIVRTRPYFDLEYRNVNAIMFLELDAGIELNGDRIKIIPILSEESTLSQEVGESIEVEGEIVFRQILTASGKRNSSPIPTLVPERIYKVG